MEKRKVKIDNTIDITKEDEEKDTYTFVIPNSSIDDLNISVKREEKKSKKQDKKKA